MAEPSLSTCSPWATAADVCAPCNDYGADLPALDDWLQVASDLLFALSGSQWPGVCTDKIRPCGYRRPDSCGCHSRTSCGCGGWSELILPAYPVVGIVAIKVNGVVVPPAHYRLDERQILVYLAEQAEADGSTLRGWPCCNRIDREDTEDETFSIEYQWGTAPPLAGVKAAAELGCQMAMSCSSDTAISGACQLPRRVTSVTRQGVSYVVLDPLTILKDGLVGLPVVDMWLSSLRVGATARGARVITPGKHRRQRRVG